MNTHQQSLNPSRVDQLLNLLLQLDFNLSAFVQQAQISAAELADFFALPRVNTVLDAIATAATRMVSMQSRWGSLVALRTMQDVAVSSENPNHRRLAAAALLKHAPKSNPALDPASAPPLVAPQLIEPPAPPITETSSPLPVPPLQTRSPKHRSSAAELLEGLLATARAPSQPIPASAHSARMRETF